MRKRENQMIETRFEKNSGRDRLVATVTTQAWVGVFSAMAQSILYGGFKSNLKKNEFL
jgi:hypothetical protein